MTFGQCQNCSMGFLQNTLELSRKTLFSMFTLEVNDMLSVHNSQNSAYE